MLHITGIVNDDYLYHEINQLLDREIKVRWSTLVEVLRLLA